MAPPEAARARQVLARDSAENPTHPDKHVPQFGWSDGVLFCGVLLLFFLPTLAVHADQELGPLWWAAGRNGPLLFEGEWWRAFTALGLYLGLAHAGINLTLVLLAGDQLAVRFGWGLAWAAMVFGAAAANVLSAALLHGAPEPGGSILGFAALGLAVVVSIKLAARPRNRLAKIQRLAVAVVLVFALGLGILIGILEPVSAAIGFGVGCLGGFLLHRLEERVVIRERHQAVAGLGASALLVLAWVAALP